MCGWSMMLLGTRSTSPNCRWNDTATPSLWEPHEAVPELEYTERPAITATILPDDREVRDQSLDRLETAEGCNMNRLVIVIASRWDEANALPGPSWV